MDHIYLRKRIRLPDGKKFRRKTGKEPKNIFIIICIISVAIGTASYILNAINPIFNTLCKEKAMGIATDIINSESSKILKDINYEDLVSITKDSDGKIKMLQVNTVKINMLASDIAYNMQQELYKRENTEISLKIGAITGIKYLSGFGPQIKIEIIPVGNVVTNIKSEFNSVGINQTIHRIYMEATCNMSIVTPYDSKEESITNQILMTESIIVGEIPESYYNLEGMSSDHLLDVVK